MKATEITQMKKRKKKSHPNDDEINSCTRSMKGTANCSVALDSQSGMAGRLSQLHC